MLEIKFLYVFIAFLRFNIIDFIVFLHYFWLIFIFGQSLNLTLIFDLRMKSSLIKVFAVVQNINFIFFMEFFSILFEYLMKASRDEFIFVVFNTFNHTAKPVFYKYSLLNPPTKFIYFYQIQYNEHQITKLYCYFFHYNENMMRMNS